MAYVHPDWARLSVLLSAVCSVLIGCTGESSGGSGNRPAAGPERFTITSSHVGDTYPISVDVPEDLEAGKRVPVVYVLDGEGHFSLVRAALERSGRLAVVVGIGNKKKRARDYVNAVCSREGGGHDRFFDFLRFELIPHVDAVYPTTDERVLMGHSFGGNFVTYAMFSEGPDDRHFSGYVVSDPSLWCDPVFFAALRDDYILTHYKFGARVHFNWANGSPGNGKVAEPFAGILAKLHFADFSFAPVEYAGTHVGILHKAYEEGVHFALGPSDDSAP